MSLRPLPPHTVDRPELLRRLDGGLVGPVTLLVAPAGSGKTVLLTQWALSRPDLEFVLIDVEPADDDPQRIVRRMLRGLRGGRPAPVGIDVPPVLGQRSIGRPMLEFLLSVLAESPNVVLVLDDLHHLTNRAVLEDLWWLAARLPDQSHIVLSSRVDVGMGWSRLRLQHSSVELRQNDLALTAQSAAAVLQLITGDDVAADVMSVVMERTEGWAAGVQLTALTLRRSQDREGFAERLSGTDRLVSEYLSEEVLAQQTPERRALLLRLSALDRMSASLVESVLGISDAAALFEDLENRSMFLVGLDERREWFRFHHLFRDLLRYRLHAHAPADETAILRAAAEWHLAHDEPDAAIEYLLEARAWGQAIDVMVSRGRTVFERSQALSMTRWLDAIPDDARRARPDAETLHGMVLGMSGNAVRAADILGRQLDQGGLRPGHAAVAHAYLAASVQFRPQLPFVLTAARSTIALLDENPDDAPPHLLGLTDPELLRTVALTSGGRALFLSGAFERARRWFERARSGPGAQYSAYQVHLLGSIALLEAWCGRLILAQALAEEALELARQADLLVHAAPADAYLAAALVAIERGDPTRGALSLHEGAVRAASNGRAALLWIAHLEHTLSDAPDASLPGELALTPPPPIVDAALRAAAARARRATGSSSPSAAAPAEWSPLAAESIAAALTAGNPPLARRLLEAVPAPSVTEAPLAAVERRMLVSWLATAEGDPARAQSVMRDALRLAEQHTLVSVFLRGGATVLRIIAALPGARDDFRGRVLERASASAAAPSSSDRLHDPLTDRELEILAFLPTRLTNIEIGAQCFVSLNTIKTHMAHIYRKLDVPNRNAAVARATELGLLS